MKTRDAQKLSDKVVDLLKAERIRQKTSMYRIGQDTELSKTAVTHIEKHRRRPTLVSLFILSSYLGISLADIIKQVEDK